MLSAVDSSTSVAIPILNVGVRELESEFLRNLALIPNESYKSSLLLKLAPSLSKQGTQEALNIACGMKSIFCRLRVSITLAIAILDEAGVKEKAEECITRDVISLLKSDHSIDEKRTILCGFPLSLVIENSKENIEEIVNLIKKEMPFVAQNKSINLIEELLPAEVVVEGQRALVEGVKSIEDLGERYRTLLGLLEGTCLTDELRAECKEMVLNAFEEMLNDGYVIDSKWLEGLDRTEWLVQQWRILPFVDKKLRSRYESLFYDHIKYSKASSQSVQEGEYAGILSVIYDLLDFSPYLSSIAVKEQVQMNIYASISLICRFAKDISDHHYFNFLDKLLKQKMGSYKANYELLGAISCPKYRSLTLKNLTEYVDFLTARGLARRALKIRKQVPVSNTTQEETMSFNTGLLRRLTTNHARKVADTVFKQIIENIGQENGLSFDVDAKVDILMEILPYLSNKSRKRLMKMAGELESYSDKACIYGGFLSNAG